MGLVNCRFQDLNPCQISDVLRGVVIVRLAVSVDGLPYVVPMHFQMEMDASGTTFHMMSLDSGMKMKGLTNGAGVCLEFEQETCSWMDTVVAAGHVAAADQVPGCAVHLQIHADTMTGRRYFRHE